MYQQSMDALEAAPLSHSIVVNKRRTGGQRSGSPDDRSGGSHADPLQSHVSAPSFQQEAEMLQFHTQFTYYEEQMGWGAAAGDKPMLGDHSLPSRNESVAERKKKPATT